MAKKRSFWILLIKIVILTKKTYGLHLNFCPVFLVLELNWFFSFQGLRSGSTSVSTLNFKIKGGTGDTGEYSWYSLSYGKVVLKSRIIILIWLKRLKLDDAKLTLFATVITPKLTYLIYIINISPTVFKPNKIYNFQQ